LYIFLHVLADDLKRFYKRKEEKAIKNLREYVRREGGEGGDGKENAEGMEKERGEEGGEEGQEMEPRNKGREGERGKGGGLGGGNEVGGLKRREEWEREKREELLTMIEVFLRLFDKNSHELREMEKEERRK
jgi:hypothetical protein